MHASYVDFDSVTKGLRTKSDKIRALAREGHEQVAGHAVAHRLVERVACLGPVEPHKCDPLRGTLKQRLVNIRRVVGVESCVIRDRHS